VYENKLTFAKEWIYDAEKEQSEINNAYELIEVTFGKGFVSWRGFENYRTYERENGGRERSYSGATVTRDDDGNDFGRGHLWDRNGGRKYNLPDGERIEEFGKRKETEEER